MTIAVMLRLSEGRRFDDGLAGELEVVTSGARHRFGDSDELLALLHSEIEPEAATDPEHETGACAADEVGR